MLDDWQMVKAPIEFDRPRGLVGRRG